MGAILNGLSLVKVRRFGSGFFIFVDYMRGSMRLMCVDGTPGYFRVHSRLDWDTSRDFPQSKGVMTLLTAMHRVVQSSRRSWISELTLKHCISSSTE